MKNQISNIAVLLIILSLFIISCNREESNIESITVDSYAEKHIEITNKIYNILSNKYLNDENFIFDGNVITKLNNEQELDKYLLKIGFDENEKKEFLSLMKEDEMLIYNLSNHNEEFKLLDEKSKREVISSKLEFYYDKTNPIRKNKLTARTCNEQWDVDISRCKRNYTLETGLSVVGGIFTGGVGGLIGFAGATAHWTFCLKDARDDYYDCKNELNEK